MALAVRLSCALALAAVALAGPITAVGQERRATESEVKAAYIFQFGRFVRWPTGTIAEGRPFTVCVLGRDPFGATLDATLANETINGRQAVVARFTKPAELGACQIVFVAADEALRLDEILRALDRTPALTVSDMPRFTERGGMVQFVNVDNRVRFEINLTATEAARLMLSSELSRVALTIRRQKPVER